MGFVASLRCIVESRFGIPSLWIGLGVLNLGFSDFSVGTLCVLVSIEFVGRRVKVGRGAKCKRCGVSFS